ncbi:MAG: FISUMP domain-containing protein [Flavobacteriales bacterium]
MKIKLFIISILSVIALNSKAQTVTDIDGNVYNTVIIGTQKWMQKNLKVTRFNNGIEIPTTSLPVNNDTMALYQWAFDEDTSNINIYGRLYTWNIVNSNDNVCPVGWKVPNNSDWDVLKNFLGGEFIAGGKMKEMGTTHWLITDSLVTNSSGFTGLGSGTRGNPSGFSNLDERGSFWSATPFGSPGFPRGNVYSLVANNNALLSSVAVAQNGKSIRCIEVEPVSIETYSFQSTIQIFPNPAKNELSISFEEKMKCRISIYDILGNFIYEQELVDKLNYLDITFLSQGAYVILLNSEQEMFSYKFIKQ